MSESVLLWDELRIHIYRIKHGKLRIREKMGSIIRNILFYLAISIFIRV